MNKKLIEKTKEYINSKHNYIKTLHFYDKDYSNDACIVFRRKVCYGCTNCISYTFFFDRVCFVLSPYQFNYLDVKKIGFDTMKNLDDFEDDFFEFIDKINTTIGKYNSIINGLTNYIDNINDDGEVKNISINYFTPLQKWINKVLKNKYNEEIIKSTYNYYQPIIEIKMKNIFDDVFNKWKKILNIHYLNLV